MPFEPGKEKTGGRQTGTPNKATTKAREAIAALVDSNIDKVQKWLDEIYEQKGAQAALDSFTGMIEYHVPKLARTDVQALDKDGEPADANWTLKLVDARIKHD